MAAQFCKFHGKNFKLLTKTILTMYFHHQSSLNDIVVKNGIAEP